MVLPDIYSVCRILCSQYHPYPFVLEDPADVPVEECWFARPQLHFTYYLRARDGRSPTGRCTYGEDDIQVQLMFYSTFEVLDLPSSQACPMET